MNLYQLTGAAMQLQELLENGEIDQQTFDDTLSCLDIDTKVENICKVIKNLEAQANAFKEEKDRLAKRQKVAENGIRRLKDSLLTSMQVLNKPKIDAGTFTVSVGKSRSVKIIDETWLPDKYLVYEPAKVDKVAIAKDIKDGIAVAGAEMEETQYVRIK